MLFLLPIILENAARNRREVEQRRDDASDQKDYRCSFHGDLCSESFSRLAGIRLPAFFGSRLRVYLSRERRRIFKRNSNVWKDMVLIL